MSTHGLPSELSTDQSFLLGGRLQKNILKRLDLVLFDRAILIYDLANENTFKILI